ncbi:MAG: alpha/beta hydrolase [Chitinophagales bacterium]|nr:alpha/beta hydrolase [Chitinophagales bacterium]
MKIYCFPGLGADKRMYDYLFSHGNWDAEVLEFRKPAMSESMESYAKSYIDQIDTSHPFAFIGTSLGGMIAVELSKVCEPKRVVLISSLKTKAEIPILIKSQRYLPLYKMLKGKNYKKFNSVFGKLYGHSGKNNLKNLIMEMGENTDDELIEWAVREVINWDNEYVPENLMQIHGDKDILFPPSNIDSKELVKGGSHIMVLTHSSQIYKAIDSFLSN